MFHTDCLSSVILTATFIIDSFQFSLNVFTKLSEFSDKNNNIKKKTTAALEITITCVRDRDSTTVPERHSWQRRQSEVILQWFSDSLHSLNLVNSMKVLIRLGKIPLSDCLGWPQDLWNAKKPSVALFTICDFRETLNIWLSLCCMCPSKVIKNQ